MKKILLPLLFISLLPTGGNAALLYQDASSGCDSINDELTSKFRFLGGWDENGKPDYLEAESDSISQSLINFVMETLPETVPLPGRDDSYFNDSVQLNTVLLEESKVYLTMVHEGARWTNTLGYYTYDINNPPKTVYDLDSLVILFPNVSQPNVIEPGNKILLGEFPANTSIGYFIIAQGWVGDTICIPSHIVFTDRQLNTFTTEEYRQQTILLHYEQEDQFLLGFEDIMRPAGDNDFNDAVFYVTAEPGAIDTTDIPTIATASLSGDTILCDVSDPAILQVHLSGQPPFSIVYNDGVQDIEITDIEDTLYTFETTAKGIIALVSMQDKNKPGIVSGQAVISVSELNAEPNIVQPVCGNGDAAIQVALSGNAPWTITYTINGTQESISTDEDTLTIAVSEPGGFELVKVSDIYCENNLNINLDIAKYEIPNGIISGDTTLCQNQEAVISVELTGTAPFTFTIFDGEQEETVTTENAIYEFVTTEFKTFTLTDLQDEHCEGTVEGSATVYDGAEEIQAEIDAGQTSCFGENINLALLGETDNLAVNWTTDGNGTFDNTDQNTTVYYPGEGESGAVNFYAELNNGCAVKTINKEVNIIEELDASFEYSPSDKLLTNTTITFTPANGNYDEYSWDFGDGNTSNATIATNEFREGGDYTIELTVKYAGCETSNSLICTVFKAGALYVPNAFNPNAIDPENRIVKVYGNNVDENDFSFKIVNRWGKVMYHTNSFAEANTTGWSGVNRNTGEHQELNVFTYLLKGKFLDGKQFELVGTITQVK